MSTDPIPTGVPGAGDAFGTPGSNSSALPPPPPQFFLVGPREAKLGQIYVAATAILLALCLLTFGTRMYNRMRPAWNVGLDDYFITAGVLLSIVDYGMLTPSIHPYETMVPFSNPTLKFGWIAIGIWGLSMTCIKVSIALTLLRIQRQSLWWRIFLYFIMGIQVAYGVLNLFFNLVIACRPLAAAWDMNLMLSNPNYCVPQHVMAAASNTGSAINITTDVLLSLAPAVFLRKLTRPLRERLFVCFLMGLGLFATLSSILKTVAVQRFYDPTTPFEDFFPVSIAITTWTILEQFSGILAACIPALKGIFQRCLGTMGVSLHDSRSRPGRSGYNRSGNVKDFEGTGTGAALTSHSRFERVGGKEDLLEDEEKYLELTDRRPVATPRSNMSASSCREGDLRLPTQGV